MAIDVGMRRITGAKSRLVDGQYGSAILEIDDRAGARVRLFFAKDQIDAVREIAALISEAVAETAEVA